MSKKGLIAITIICCILSNLFIYNDLINRRYERMTADEISRKEEQYEKEAILLESINIAQDIQEEGSVLLVNNNDVLPLVKPGKIKLYNINDKKIIKKYEEEFQKNGYECVNNNEEVAIVVIRSRKEVSSLINEKERRILDTLKEKKEIGNLNKIILLLEIESLCPINRNYENEYDIDACVWVGSNPNIEGLINILVGNKSPSGRLVETVIQDNSSSPSYQNYLLQKKEKKQYIMQEGIYIGYKYYESRYNDYCRNIGNTGMYDYYNDVIYPFGFGMSYTSFEYSNLIAQYDEMKKIYKLTIDIKNVGEKNSGKEVVQVYLQSQYTDYDVENYIEKSAVSLVGFSKTNELKPGEKQQITIEIDEKDLTSYDLYGLGAYIMEQGNYFLTVASNAHDAVNNFLAANNYNIENTDGRMDQNGNARLVCCWREKTTNVTICSNSASEKSLLNMDYTNDQAKCYLSRRDWELTLPSDDKLAFIKQKMDENLQNGIHNEGKNTIRTKKNKNSDTKLTLYDMVGSSVENQKWNDLLSQMTEYNKKKIVVTNIPKISAVPKLGIPEIRIKNEERIGKLLTSNELSSATFNLELIKKNGNNEAKICKANNISHLIVSGNQVNKILCDTDFYSEDAYLTGKISGIKYNEMQNAGVNIIINDFIYGSKINVRNYVINEQALREIYLRLIEKPLAVNNKNGINLSDVKINGEYVNENRELIKKLYRQEWKCEGIILSKSNRCNINVNKQLESGVSLIVSDIPLLNSKVKLCKNDGKLDNEIDELIKYNLNTVTNSFLKERIDESMNKIYVPTIYYYIELVIAIVFGLSSLYLVIVVFQNRKEYR